MKCARQEQAGPLAPDATGLYSHRIGGRCRFAAGVIGGLVLPLIMLNQSATTSGASIAAMGLASFGLSLLGETLERTLFFTAAVAPRMPGALKT